MKNDMIVLDLELEEGGCTFEHSIVEAQARAEAELIETDELIDRNFRTVKELTPDCDKTDYMLAAAAGALCGIMDIFMVGKPGESPAGNITDKWFSGRVKDFAARLDKAGEYDTNTISGSLKCLSDKFGLKYVQSMSGLDFKALSEDPTLSGLFFAILDQFNRQTDFAEETGLVLASEEGGRTRIEGGSVTGKLFGAFVNWLENAISESSGRAVIGKRASKLLEWKGIPAPIKNWIKELTDETKKLEIPDIDLDYLINSIALKVYEEGYDERFLTAQAIPVTVNEMIVRLIYSVRRAVRFVGTSGEKKPSFEQIWESSMPFSNISVKRMVTVAHGTFCLVDGANAFVKSYMKGEKKFDIPELVMRLNVIGIGIFSFTLYGEIKRGIKRRAALSDLLFLGGEKALILDYIEGLKTLSYMYDDSELLDFVNDVTKSGMYKKAFLKSVDLAERRMVPEGSILRTKEDINAYFTGGRGNE